ncbi:MAG: oxidative damage protection protein [Deltaproteobacteria bacterium]|nr:oxidative damage protection protein [Deltaproteobacteria bacterium]
MKPCLRCAQETEGLPNSPYPGELGSQIQKNVCEKCWEEWKKFSVMVINDYKLRPYLPRDRAVVEQNMRQFFKLS